MHYQIRYGNVWSFCVCVCVCVCVCGYAPLGYAWMCANLRALSRNPARMCGHASWLAVRARARAAD